MVFVLTGIQSVLVTPFTENGEIDIASLRRLVEHNLSWGVEGIVCFGLAGELYKLDDADRRRVLEAVVDTVAGAVPVIAGAEHSGVEAAARRCVDAVGLGADALMLYPPTFAKPDPAGIEDYYETVGAATPAPVIVQDAPAWTGVPLPVDLLDRIGRSPTVRHVKVEVQPSAPKIRALRDRGLQVIGGFGALHLAEELDAGIIGTMPGCALPGLYVEIWRHHVAGDRLAAYEAHARALPLLSFQVATLDLFVAVQKVLLERIGVIDSTRMRRPTSPLFDSQVAWLDELLSRTGSDLYLGYER